MKCISFTHVRKGIAGESCPLLKLLERQRSIKQILHSKCLGMNIHAIHQIRLLHHVRPRIAEALHINVFGRGQHTHA